MNSTEVSLMKGVCCKLNDDTCLTLCFLAHTEKGARDKSEYFYYGRIDKIEDLRAEAEHMLDGDNRVKHWTLPNLTKYDAVVYDEDSLNSRGGNWYKCKLDKMVNFDMFIKILDGWKATKKTFNSNAKYASTDYIVSDGSVISDLKTSKDQLIGLVGKTIIHINQKNVVQTKSEVKATETPAA